MSDSTRMPTVEDEEFAAGESPQVADTSGISAPSPTRGEAKFIGSAMKALFESSDVSISRGDETRVMSRAQEALEKLHSRHPSSRPPAADPHQQASAQLQSSAPPRPRVDAVLWIVLAVGLFGIAGWMIASAL